MFDKVTDLKKAQGTSSITELNKYLLIGAESGDLALVKYCLEAGADPSVKVRFGRNALHIAAERGDLKMGELLLTSRTDINMGTYHSYTPLHLACNSSKYEFLDFLLLKGADINIKDKLGRTTLHYAIGNRDERMTATCLKHGANVNAMDALQSTPLSLAAVDIRCLSLVTLLLQYNADPNLERRLCIPIFLDCILNVNKNVDCSETYSILSLLLMNGVSPNVVDPTTKKNGMHYAAMSGNVDMGVFLVENGTDPNAKDNLGRTPLDIARQFKHYDMVHWLQRLLLNWVHVSENSFTPHDLYF